MTAGKKIGALIANFAGYPALLLNRQKKFEGEPSLQELTPICFEKLPFPVYKKTLFLSRKLKMFSRGASCISSMLYCDFR